MKKKTIFIIFLLFMVLGNVRGKSYDPPYDSGAWSSAFGKTYQGELNSSGARIAYNDDYFGMEACVNTSQAYLKVDRLPVETYNVVSERYSQNGDIKTTIQGTYPYGGIQISNDRNYRLIVTPTTGRNKVTNLTQDQSIQRIEYFDGLGRPIETIQRGITPTKNDLVSYQEYDALGRESNAWIPAVVSENNAAFVTFSNFKTQANNTYGNEPKPHTSRIYETSPLNRVLEQYNPGSDWHTNKRSVKTAYLTNIAGNDTLNCINYAVTDHATIDTIMTISRTGNYATSRLYVTRTADEDGNISFEFKNKLGQMILTRQLNGATKDPHDTYYIYDDFGNLKAVLPPMAADAMKTGTSWTSNTDVTLKEYAYLYRYDNSNRCIMKKLPGAGCTRNIYDKSNRLIFTQDAKKQWLFSIPDSLGRTVLTGTLKTINGSSNILNSDYENSLVVASFAINGAHNYYTIKKDAGTLTLDTPSYLITSYYDNYDFMVQGGFSGLTYSLPTGVDSRFNTRSTNVNAAKTLLTGSIVGDADGGATKIYSAMYYDNRGRMIQSRSTNHLGGTESEYIAYTFTGKPIKRLKIHTNSGDTIVIEKNVYKYDHADRLLATRHSVGDSEQALITRYAYDELGRLQSTNRNTYNRINNP